MRKILNILFISITISFPSFANAQIIEIGMCYRIENYNNGVFKDYWNLEDHNKSNTLYYKFLDKPTKRNNQYWSLWEGEWGTDNEDIKDLKEQGYKSVKMYEKTIITINLSNNTIIKLKVLTDDLLNHYSNVYSKLYDLKKKYPNKWRSTGGFLDNDEEGSRSSDDEEPFSGIAFKIATDPFVGSLTFVRVYSGVLSTGDSVFLPIKGKKERIGRMLQMHSNKRDEISEARAGDICAVIGLKEAITGETLCDEKNKITLESMNFPEPVISVAVEPKTKEDQEKMGVALGRLAQEDPSFRLRTDEESGQTIMSGMGELHLDVLVDRMRREFGVEANVGKPQVAYRESIRKYIEEEAKFVRQSGGRGQYGHVYIKMEPLDEPDEEKDQN